MNINLKIYLKFIKTKQTNKIPNLLIQRLDSGLGEMDKGSQKGKR